MAQVIAQLEAIRSVAFIPDNVSSAAEQDEDVLQDELDELEDAQDDFKDDEMESPVDIKYVWSPCFVIVG